MLRSLRLGKSRQLQAAQLGKPFLGVGQTGEGVAAIQSLLLDLGYPFVRSFKNGKADGIFGSETKRNVVGFQTKAGLKPDGIIGPSTLGKLEQLIADNNILEDHLDSEIADENRKNRNPNVNRRTRVVT